MINSGMLDDILKREFVMKFAEEMMKTVEIEEVRKMDVVGEGRYFNYTTYGAEVIYMTKEQWTHIMGMLGSLRILKNPEVDLVVRDIINEIYNH